MLQPSDYVADYIRTLQTIGATINETATLKASYTSIEEFETMLRWISEESQQLLKDIATDRKHQTIAKDMNKEMVSAAEKALSMGLELEGFLDAAELAMSKAKGMVK